MALSCSPLPDSLWTCRLKIWKYFVHHVTFFIYKVVSWSQKADYKVKSVQSAENDLWVLKKYFLKFWLFSSFSETRSLGCQELLYCDFCFNWDTILWIAFSSGLLCRQRQNKWSTLWKGENIFMDHFTESQKTDRHYSWEAGANTALLETDNIRKKFLKLPNVIIIW